jgi:hypothetical protein
MMSRPDLHRRNGPGQYLVTDFSKNSRRQTMTTHYDEDN